MTAKGMARKLLDIVSSFQLAVALLLAMLLITYLGTLHQVEHGLYQAIQDYFHTFIIFQKLPGPFELPLPGGYLLMGLLTINLICGGLMRMRWDRYRSGVIITHFGILFLMISALVTAELGLEGQMVLVERGEEDTELNQAAHFFDSRRLELVVLEVMPDGDYRQYRLDQYAFADLSGEQQRRVEHPELPFALVMSHFVADGRPRQVSPLLEGPSPTPVIDGWFINPNPDPPTEASARKAGLYVEAVGIPEPQRSLLWSDWLPPHGDRPWTLTVDDRRFAVLLRNVRYELPFAIRLEDFRHEFYPNTRKPRSFESDVTVIADGVEQPVHIEMNQPLRRGPYVAYQQSWGPQGPPPADGRYFSVLQVARNPSDQWPKWATYVIGFGLCLHFGWMLVRYVRRETAENR